MDAELCGCAVMADTGLRYESVDPSYYQMDVRCEKNEGVPGMDAEPLRQCIVGLPSALQPFAPVYVVV
jgi:hypothetical protein